jgi:hypothetical protein
MHHHVHLGDVGAILRDGGDLPDARLRKRRDARELFGDPVRQIDKGAERA